MKKVVAALALLAPLATLAQNWKLEPDAVFGIKIGAVLNYDDIRHCGDAVNPDEKPRIPVCAKNKPMFGDGVMLFGPLPIDAFSLGGAIIREGVVTTIELSGDNQNYAQARRVLMERYGKPTKATKETVQNKLGASFTSERLVWMGKRVMLTLDERAGTVSDFSAMFTHIGSALKSGEAQDAKTKKDASKL